MTMRIMTGLSLIFVSAALLSGCNTVSESEYKLGRQAVAESPTVRAEVVKQCVAERNRESAAQQQAFADYLKIPRARYAQTVCNRLIAAYAKGRITYADMNSQAGGEKVLKILKGR